MAATDRPECFAGLQTAPLKAPEESESALMVSECVRNPVRTLISAYLFQSVSEGGLGFGLRDEKAGAWRGAPCPGEPVTVSGGAQSLRLGLPSRVGPDRI